MATESEALLTIGQVAERAGIRVSHVRYYEEVGVLPAPERVSGQRRYSKTCCTASRSSTSRSAPASRSTRSVA